MAAITPYQFGDGNVQKAYDTIIGITPPNKLGWEKQKDGSLTATVWKAPMQKSEQTALGIPYPKWGQELQGMARTIYSFVPKKFQKQIIDSGECAVAFTTWLKQAKDQLENYQLRILTDKLTDFANQFRAVPLSEQKRGEAIAGIYETAQSTINIQLRSNQGYDEIFT